MKGYQFPLLPLKEQSTLQDALHYMKMAELKKALLIERILTLIKDGIVILVPQAPVASLAKNHPIQSLSPSSLMLYGSYKNDLKTRNFFKKLIGPQFHFTAFGIDWLNEHWLQGKPPTYQEFADFWSQETAQHKQEKPKPKDEWMFIRFMQQMEKEEPEAKQEDLLHAWKQVQWQKREEGFQLLDKANKVLK